MLCVGAIELVLWWKSTDIMESLGSKSDSHFFGLINLIQFAEKIKKEKNIIKREKYQTLLIARILLIVVYVIGGILILANT